MPYSDSSFDQQIKEFIKEKKFLKYLDIGSGAGKYGRIIKETIDNSFVEGIEMESEYVKKFKLKDFYDKIYVNKVETFFDNKFDYQTDLVIIGDCIEHLKKSDGIDLIHFLIYRCRWLIIVFPTKVIQYSWEGHSSEAHRSVWSKDDFKGFDYKFYRKKFMNLISLKGYLEDKNAIKVD